MQYTIILTYNDRDKKCNEIVVYNYRVLDTNIVLYIEKTRLSLEFQKKVKKNGTKRT